MLDFIHYGLLAGLAIALLFAAFTDIRRRQIDNWLNAAIALGAPVFWWSQGLSPWPDIALQFGVALLAFAILAGLFALRVMGGGDVKLLTALALWIEPALFVQLLVMMALAGGVLTVVMGSWHLMRRRRERLAIPYGVAIAIGGLWVLGAHYLPEAGRQAAPAVVAHGAAAVSAETAASFPTGAAAGSTRS
ncbi:prepilin peptidase [Erythrobacter sp. HL-111]|uniref:A24 family peptidase n=1 Tax=Erythrobacter sp. HL-111 TaxID=1798193 RepID=UPI0006DBB7C0|nr:MAG: Tad secretion system prepilin peptidase TadV [Erythrobacteraceae bacterium HL-111]SDT10980.1 prepilin peptidase CpaA [Erythrobacter sp. HL-111]